MNLLAQAPITYSFDTSLLVIAGVVAMLWGGMYAIRRRRPMTAIMFGLLSLLLAAWIVLARRYDPEFVVISVALLVLCFSFSAGLGFWQLGRRIKAEI